MKRILLILPYLAGLGLAIAQDVSLEEVERKLKEGEEYTPAKETTSLTLEEAIAKGLRKNNQQKVRDYQREIFKLDWKDSYDAFWFPQLNLTVNTSNHHVESLYNDQKETLLSETPSGFVGLEFEDYTIFNWGRDYLQYLNDQATFERQNQALDEKRRALRFSIIDQYFNLSKYKRIRSIKKSQLRHTSFIYRLSKEKLGLGKIGKQEFLQAKGEFLRAHKEFQQVNALVAQNEQDMAKLLGDDLETSYTLVNQLKFTPLNIKKSESLGFAQERSPQLRQARTELENANRSYEKTLKENLPLPEFTVRLGAYRHGFSDQGVEDTVTTYGDGRNVEVAASINMKWRIFGSGGFMNSRDKERSYFNKRIAEINFYENKRGVKVEVGTLHRSILHLEQTVEAAQARLKNARDLFDTTLDRYISGKTSFPDMKLVLDGLIQSEEELETAKYQHLAQKLNLANASGIDDFPGEKFDNLVLK